MSWIATQHFLRLLIGWVEIILPYFFQNLDHIYLDEHKFFVYFCASLCIDGMIGRTKKKKINNNNNGIDLYSNFFTNFNREMLTNTFQKLFLETFFQENDKKKNVVDNFLDFP